MKSGLQNSPALSVPCFLARQQPIAHKFPKQDRSRIAQKRVLAGNENFFDESRIVNQINMLREEAKVGNGSIALRRLFEEVGFEIERSTYANITFFLPILAIRKLMRLTGLKTESENNINLSAFNGALGTLLGGERRILRFTNLPFGVSGLCVAKKGHR